MAEPSEHDSTEYLRAIQVRMMRHSLDHLPKAIGARTAMIVIKNGLLKSLPENPLPEALFKIIQNPNHPQRWPDCRGPFILFHKDKKPQGIIELATIFLSPVSKVRAAALAELERKKVECPQFVSPETNRRIDELRESVVSDDIPQALAASVEIHDRLDDDYFYNVAGVRQCARLRIDGELPRFFERVLAPNERTIQFLFKLPVWSLHRQLSDIERMRGQILDSATSLPQLLNEYFRLFGHLPLAGRYSVGGVSAVWCERNGEPENPWKEIWSWVKSNGSPLARYHACQLLCQRPDWVNEQERDELFDAIANVIEGVTKDHRWKRRCDLARHFCRHLESLAPGADSERVAAYSWWFSEFLCDTIDAFNDKAKNLCAPMLEEACRISDEVWTICRPPVTGSTLRYATLLSASMWSTALLSELARSDLLAHMNQHRALCNACAGSLQKLAYVPLPSKTDSADANYAFEGSVLALARRIAEAVGGAHEDSIRSLQSVLAKARSDDGLGSMIKLLPEAQKQEAEEIAHEVRLLSFCADPPCDDLWTSFSDSNWRQQVLVDGDRGYVEMICNAAIAVQLRDSSHDWRSYLPHFLAMACEEAPVNNERKRLLFGYTVVSSLAVDSVSAVERLLKGDHRREYEDFVAKWRERIERATPVAPNWISARLRGMKAVLSVN